MKKSDLKKLEDGTIEITITVDANSIADARKKIIEELVKTSEVKGFRPGKAPKNLVEKQLKPETIYREVINLVIPEAYSKAIKEQGIKPMVNPLIELVNAQVDQDWIFKAVTAEKPEIDLGDYKKNIKAETPANIIIPGKEEPKKEEKLDKIFEALIKTVSVKIPHFLIDQEVDRMLSRLVEQTQKLGLNVEQYLASISKTVEQLRGEYHVQAEKTLKLEFILMAIADAEKLSVSEEEVSNLIASVPEETSRKTLETPAQRAYVREILRKQRVIDILNTL